MYKWQEILCPICAKKYMIETYETYDLIVKLDGNTLKGWQYVCHRCNNELFVIDGILESMDLKTIPSENIIEKNFILR